MNFPSVPADEIKGVRAGYMGRGRWVKEFRSLDEAEAIAASLNGAPTGDPSEKPAEKMYKLVGNFSSDADNSSDADHLLTDNGYVSIVPHTIDSTDYEQLKILSEVAF